MADLEANGTMPNSQGSHSLEEKAFERDNQLLINAKTTHYLRPLYTTVEKSTSMIGENRQLVINEPVDFEQ